MLKIFSKTAWLFILATLIILPFLLRLGFWQLDRAEEKRQILMDYHQRMQQTPLTSLPDKTDLRYVPVRLTGRFINEKTFLLDNRIYKGQVGYDVIVPFIPDKEQKGILVNRGWIASGKNRGILPEISPVQGIQLIEGTLTSPSLTILLGSQEENPEGWPRIIQRIEPEKISTLLHTPLHPYILMLKSDTPFAYTVNWTPTTVLPERHIAYAVQWFGLAIVWIIGLLVILFKTRGSKK